MTLKELNIQPNTKSILVTGPQRSGTTIAAKMIAQKSGLHYVDENLIKVDDLGLFFKLHDELDNYVMQAPGLSFICHRLPVDLVVFMQRDGSDIQASEARINWYDKWNQYELEKYFYDGEIHGIHDSWETKYHTWTIYQKPLMDKNNKRYFDLDYESLQSHPLWIDKPQRVNFKDRQTTL